MVDYELGPSLGQEVYSVQYVVPVDADGKSIVLPGMSPNVRRKDDLDRMFAEIAETLEIDRLFF